MKKIYTYAVLLFILFGFFFFKAENTAFASDITHISDEAGLFTEIESNELETLCEEIGSLYNMDIILLTVDGITGTRKQYLEDYYDAHDTVLSDAAILLLNMDPDDRGVEIQGYGQCELNLSDDRIESILDGILPYFSEANYFEGLQQFVTLTDHYMNVVPTVTMTHAEMEVAEIAAKKAIPHFRNFMISLAIGIFVIAVMLYNSGSHMTSHQGTYLDTKDSRILGSYDRYIRTTTTKRAKPKETSSGRISSGGGGGGGVSSGGNSHSGGGRSF